MPFKSEKQRRWMHINKPSIAKAWEKEYKKGGLNVLKAKGGKDASMDDYKTPSAQKYSRSYNPGAGGVVQHGTVNQKNVSTGGNEQNIKRRITHGGSGPHGIQKTVAPVGVAPNFIQQQNTKKYLGLNKKKEKSTLEKFKEGIANRRNKGMLKFTHRTKASNLKDLGMVPRASGINLGKKQIPLGPVAALADAFYVPKETHKFDIDSIREIASTKKGGVDKWDAKTLGHLRQDIQMENKLKKGNVSQAEFDKYKNRLRVNMPRGGDGPVRCPDGTLPPCKTTAIPTTVTPKKQNTFLGDFQAYEKGGLTKTVPPKKGPNPEVPPVKLRKGKLTKKYIGSCPHRPDGIRGMGAAIRGHKFTGVK